MNVNKFDEFLSKLIYAPVLVLSSGAHPEHGAASVVLEFLNGSWLRADYWRMIVGGRAGISSFDHQQKYGLPAPINAIRELEEQLRNKLVTDARLEKESGD